METSPLQCGHVQVTPAAPHRLKGRWGRKSFPPQALTLQHEKNFVWMMFRDTSVLHGGSLFPHLGPLAYMPAQAFGDTMWVHILAGPAQGPQLATSMVLTATYGKLHPGSSLSAHPKVVPTEAIVGKVTPANQVLLVVLPMETQGVCLQPPEGMDPGGIQHPGPGGVA